MGRLKIFDRLTFLLFNRFLSTKSTPAFFNDCPIPGFIFRFIRVNPIHTLRLGYSYPLELSKLDSLTRTANSLKKGQRRNRNESRKIFKWVSFQFFPLLHWSTCGHDPNFLGLMAPASPSATIKRPMSLPNDLDANPTWSRPFWRVIRARIGSGCRKLITGRFLMGIKEDSPRLRSATCCCQYSPNIRLSTIFAGKNSDLLLTLYRCINAYPVVHWTIPFFRVEYRVKYKKQDRVHGHSLNSTSP